MLLALSDLSNVNIVVLRWSWVRWFLKGVARLLGTSPLLFVIHRGIFVVVYWWRGNSYWTAISYWIMCIVVKRLSFSIYEYGSYLWVVYWRGIVVLKLSQILSSCRYCIRVERHIPPRLFFFHPFVWRELSWGQRTLHFNDFDSVPSWSARYPNTLELTVHV